MVDFLKGIGITKQGVMRDNSYVITLTEQEWGKYLSLLERCDELEEDEDSSLLSYDSSSQQFLSEKYIITLLGDLDSERYTLTIKEI